MSNSFTLDYLAGYLGAELTNPEQGHQQVCAVNTLLSAGLGDISFLANRKYAWQLAQTTATAVLVSQENTDKLPCVGLVVKDPYLAYARLSRLFDRRCTFVAGIDQTAVVASSAQVDPDSRIGAGVVIGEHACIGANVYIGPNSVIGDSCVIGVGTRIEAGVVLYDDVQVGDNCLIHSGAVIGADGFGFAPSSEGWVKISQLGGVRIADEVEVGAGTTIDRGALNHTRLEQGVKLDNQVQIAHNVFIGEHSAIAGGTAVAGSTHIGSRCTIAGLSGITGHLHLAERTHVTAMTLVSKSVEQPGQVISSGTGQEMHQRWKKNVVHFRQLDQYAKRLKTLEKQVDSMLEEGRNS